MCKWTSIVQTHVIQERTVQITRTNELHRKHSEGCKFHSQEP